MIQPSRIFLRPALKSCSSMFVHSSSVNEVTASSLIGIHFVVFEKNLSFTLSPRVKFCSKNIISCRTLIFCEKWQTEGALEFVA